MSNSVRNFIQGRSTPTQAPCQKQVTTRSILRPSMSKRCQNHVTHFAPTRATLSLPTTTAPGSTQSKVKADPEREFVLSASFARSAPSNASSGCSLHDYAPQSIRNAWYVGNKVPRANAYPRSGARFMICQSSLSHTPCPMMLYPGGTRCSKRLHPRS